MSGINMTRVVLGGFGQIPLLAMDGPDSAGMVPIP